MPNTWFRFKQFIVYQDKCAMKVGTDGVLLGAWTRPNHAKRIADLGSGTGLLSLMLAQKCNAEIDAFEKDPAAAEQCRKNLECSPWSDKLSLICGDIFSLTIEGNYDWVICNPPFHTEKIISPKLERALARTAETDIETWFSLAWKICNEQGKASFILPSNRETEYINSIKLSGWYIEKLCRIIPNEGKSPVRIMVQLCKMPTETEISELIIEGKLRGEYTEQYINLCRDYYLHF